MSQSWGWKSSALRSEDYIGIPSEKTEEGVLGWVGDVTTGESGHGVRSSLRAAVVVGVI